MYAPAGVISPRPSSNRCHLVVSCEVCFGDSMEVEEVEFEYRVEEDDKEIGEDVGERRFKVGDLVEFWEVALVRGYRTDSGDPAWVKADYGGGEYGIKMVINTRGKLRRVHWKQLFKDGSFNKLKIRKGGPRGRTTERMTEIELGKAEATFAGKFKEQEEKFAGKLREQEEEVRKAEEERNEMQEHGERTLRLQEKKARQSEKDLSVGHKRSLMELRDDQDKKRKIDMKAQEELDRHQRVRTRNLERQVKDLGEDLTETRANQTELERVVKRGMVRLEVLRDYGDEWKRKYTEQIENKEQKMEEQIRVLDREIKDKVKQVREVEKRRTLFEDLSVTLDEKLREREKEFEELATLRRQVSTMSLSYVVHHPCHCITLYILAL